VAPLHHVAHEHDVAGGLGHLAALEQQVLAVHPVPDHLVADGAVALRPLVLVVREAQVDAARVQVEPVAEQVQRHRGALDVPAGKPKPHGLSHVISRFSPGLLPQRPVRVEALALGRPRRLQPVTRAQVLQPVARQLPYSVVRLRGEVDRCRPRRRTRVLAIRPPISAIMLAIHSTPAGSVAGATFSSARSRWKASS
jgi:hypothetical protein